jgi:hypothetical protein
LEAQTLEVWTLEVWTLEVWTLEVWTRGQRAAADRGRCVLFRLRSRRAFPPAGHSRQDVAGRNWFWAWHPGPHLLRRVAGVRTVWMVAGRAVLAYRSWDGQPLDGRSWDGRSWDGQTWDGQTWDGQTWDGRTWERRIELAWGRWAFHLAEDRYALLRCVLGQGALV